MDNTAVVSGLVLPDTGLLLEDGQAERRVAQQQLARGREPDDAASHDDRIVLLRRRRRRRHDNPALVGCPPRGQILPLRT
jgi:hypothetical protein